MIIDAWTSLNRGEKRFLVAWWAFLIAAAWLAASALVRQQSENLELSKLRHEARMDVGAAEVGRTQPERTPPPGREKDVPRTVKVGVYLDRIPEMSIVGSTWKADFYVWFAWTGDALDPGETFQVVNGEILSKTLLEKRDDGDSHYVLYRAMASITKSFDVTRFPRDDHLLTISIEDTARQSWQLRYETDAATSDISSRVAAAGYEVKRTAANVKPHSYKTVRGNPALPADFRATYSQFSFGVAIARPSWGLFFKISVILYAAVTMALLALFIRSSGDRLALQTGAIFAAAANAYITASLVPETGVATLADQINWIGIACIGLALLEGVIYQYRFEGQPDRERAARLLDTSTFVLMATLYVAINAVVALAASR